MRRKIVFVYNFFMNLLAFMAIFPTDVSGRTLYWEDVFPLNLPAMVQEADKRLDNYRDIRLRIKNSLPHEQNWIFAEYALEQARLHTVARVLTLSPAKLYCERASGRSWLDICLAHLLPAKALYSKIPPHTGNNNSNPVVLGQNNFGPNSLGQYLRDFDYGLWFCYYNQNYAVYHLKQSFYYLQFTGQYQGHLFTKPEEYQALLLNSICLNPPESNLSLGFKMRYPSAGVSGCYQEVLPKAALAYHTSVSNLRQEHAAPVNAVNAVKPAKPVKPASSAIPVPCGKILGYLESAGLGNIHEDKVIRAYARDALKKYPLSLAGRESLCE